MPKQYQHQSPRQTQLSFQGLLLYILPAPLVIKFFVSLVSFNLFKLAAVSVALLFLYSGAHMTRSTLVALAQPQDKNPHRSEKDNRLWAMCYIGVGVLALMLLLRRPPLISTVMIGSAMIGYYLVYGVRAEQSRSAPDFSSMPKARREAIIAAYQDIETIEELSHRITSTDTELSTSVSQVISTSYDILAILGESPEDAGRARRFLTVYTNRIKEILQQYLALTAHNKGQDFRERLITVLNDAHEAFTKQKSKLLDDDTFKLDVQLQVLDEQINNEGA